VLTEDLPSNGKPPKKEVKFEQNPKKPATKAHSELQEMLGKAIENSQEDPKKLLEFLKHKMIINYKGTNSGQNNDKT